MSNQGVSKQNTKWCYLVTRKGEAAQSNKCSFTIKVAFLGKPLIF